MQRNLKKIRIIIVVVAVVLAVLLSILMNIEFNNVLTKSLNLYHNDQQNLANNMMSNAVLGTDDNNLDILDKIKSQITKDFPTSSSIYCMITRDDQVLFLKDENTSSTLNGEKFSDIFDHDNISLKDKQKYCLDSSELQFNGMKYTLVICAKQNYLIKKLNLNEAKIHSLGYFILETVILLVIVMISFYVISDREIKIQTLLEDAKKNRLIIENIENYKNNYYVNSEVQDTNSFYHRSIIEKVLAGMTEMEKADCIEIDILVENLKMEHFVLITAILGRIRVGNSVSCYWEENQFKVLLFHTQDEEAENFINLFISKYKLETEERIEDLKIIAKKLLTECDS